MGEHVMLKKLAAWIEEMEHRVANIETRLAGLDALATPAEPVEVAPAAEAPPKERRGRPPKSAAPTVETPPAPVVAEEPLFAEPVPAPLPPFDFMAEMKSFVHGTPGGPAITRKALDELGLKVLREVAEPEQRGFVARCKALAEEAL